MKLTIEDYNGWEKTIEFDKAVVRIGSSPTSDVELTSPDIAPIHLQLQYLPENLDCKMLNLGHAISILSGESKDTLASYARTELKHDDEILLGDYRIRVALPTTTKTTQKAKSIQASLNFPNTTLYQHSPAVGWLTVKNIGSQSPCQFHVSLSGLPADCVKIDPIPLLYSGAQEEVRVQLFHHGLYPPAGLTDLTIRVFAPSDYPGEQVLIEQGIYVSPVFEQKLEILDGFHADEAAPATPVIEPDLNMIAHSTTTSVPPIMPPPPPPQDDPTTPNEEGLEEIASSPTPIAEEEIEAPPPPSQIEKAEITAEPKEKTPEKVISTPKPVIVRNLPDEFWDDEE